MGSFPFRSFDVKIESIQKKGSKAAPFKVKVNDVKARRIGKSSQNTYSLILGGEKFLVRIEDGTPFRSWFFTDGYFRWDRIRELISYLNCPKRDRKNHTYFVGGGISVVEEYVFIWLILKDTSFTPPLVCPKPKYNSKKFLVTIDRTKLVAGPAYRPYGIKVNGVKARYITRSCRDIYRFSIGNKDYVLKIDEGFYFESAYMNGYETGQCIQEYIFFNSLEEKDKKYFAFPHALGFTVQNEIVFIWIIQEWIPGRKYISQKSDSMVTKLCIKYGLEDMEGCRNWKVNKKELKIFDYGLVGSSLLRR